jgi:hypothetical protein
MFKMGGFGYKIDYAQETRRARQKRMRRVFDVAYYLRRCDT